MIRTTRLSAVVIAGLCALFTAGCGSASTPAPAKTAAQPAPAKTAQPAPASSTASDGAAAQPSTGAGGKGDGLFGSGTLTLSGGTGSVYHLTTVTCDGEKSPSGKLGMTAGTDNPETGAAAHISFDGAGKFTVVLILGGDATWNGEGTAGAAGNRTVDTVKLTDVPMTSMTGGDAKVTGTLTCSGTQAMD